MDKSIELSELSREGLQDMLTDLISDHDKEFDIMNVLSIFTAYSVSADTIENYGLDNYKTSDLKDIIYIGIHSTKLADKQFVWDIILDTLSQDILLHIINFIDELVDDYHALIKPIEDIRERILKSWIIEHKGSIK